MKKFLIASWKFLLGICFTPSNYKEHLKAFDVIAADICKTHIRKLFVEVDAMVVTMDAIYADGVELNSRQIYEVCHGKFIANIKRIQDFLNERLADRTLTAKDYNVLTATLSSVKDHNDLLFEKSKLLPLI